jgi:hypothetical protein
MNKPFEGTVNWAAVDGEKAMWRGGSPTEKALEAMKAQGLKTIIGLEFSVDPAVKKWADANGIKLVTWDDFIPWNAAQPKEKQLPVPKPGEWSYDNLQPGHIRWMADQIQTAHAGDAGVYVHSTHGRDRTAAVLAAWRVQHCGWTKDRSWAELIQSGSSPALPGAAKHVPRWLEIR